MRDFLLFTIEQRRFAIELAAVRRVLRMVEITPLPDAPGRLAGVLNLHGEILPVVDLRRSCGLPPRAFLPSDQLLIATANDRPLALPIDAAEGVYQLPEAELAPLDRAALAQGMTAFGSEIVLLCDPGRLLAGLGPEPPEAAGDDSV